VKPILPLLAGAALVAGLLTAVTAATVPEAALAESNGGVKVMPLGDSITDGIQTPGGYRIGLWQSFTSAGTKVDFVGSLSNGPSNLGDHDHEGHSGWRIDQIDANIVGWLHTYNPRTILLHIGTNDVIQNVNLSGAPSRLGTLLDHITSTVPNAEVFVAQLIPLSYNDSAIRTFNSAVPGVLQPRVAAGKHLHLVDMHSALTTSDLTDGTHPTANGYNKMAATWLNALKSVPGSLLPVGTTVTPTPTTTSPRPTTSSPTPTTSSPTPTTSSPTPTTSSPTPTTTSPLPSGKGCSAVYTVTNTWPGGFQANVTVTATGGAISGWATSWTFTAGETVGQAWSATVTSSGSQVTAQNVSYNGTVASGASTSFGFTGTTSGSTAVPAVSCTAS